MAHERRKVRGHVHALKSLLLWSPLALAIGCTATQRRGCGNFNCDIGRGLVRRNPSLDIVRVQDIRLSGADDPTVLAWTASQGRVVVTHDVTTVTKHAFDRVASGLLMPGVFVVKSTAAVDQANDQPSGPTGRR